jgi:Protein of unknown function (DUF1631)
MTPPPNAPALAQAARRAYADTLVRASAGVQQALHEALQKRLLQPALPRQARAWQDTLAALQQHGSAWQMGLIRKLRLAQRETTGARSGDPIGGMSLVADATIQREIEASRLALSVPPDAHSQFTDLRNRMLVLEKHKDLAPHDLLQAAVVATLWVEAWAEADLGHVEWQHLQDALQHEFGLWIGTAYHDANHWLLEQGVLPDIDLRPFIRRSQGIAASAAIGVSFVESTQRRASNSIPPDGRTSAVTAGPAPSAARPSPREVHATPLEAGGSPGNLQAADVLAQLQQVLRRKVPALASPKPSLADAPHARQAPMRAEGLVQASPRLQAVIQRAQEALQRPHHSTSGGQVTSAAVDEVRARSQAFKQVLKQAAATPEERATIEIVAMMFQSILQEERLPATVRVWFARLQMPVLRVAVTEPDFFATNDHPARLLIDRMGGCVLGFEAAAEAVGEVLEREIKRVVQVVEAYPDTGRRVFQTVLTEFENFLSNFFAKENPASRRGVSLAQQIEQRETLAIQYTIELRKMLADMPVADALREFLFQVWADVLAVTAMRLGGQAELTSTMKRAAADLIWSAGAKGSPEERAEVIRRLPLLLKTLRDGMGNAGLPQKKQDEHIRKLNNVLATAFTTKAAPISRDRLDELMDRLQTLESMLPSLADIDLDEGLVRDLSGHERDGMEVVSEGGTAPSPAMLAWARELSVGSWFRLQHRGRSDQVQLAWVGARHQLLLFVSVQGRAVLFPLHRLAAYLQASFLQPAQEETLTVRATRDALAKLEDDPDALLRT